MAAEGTGLADVFVPRQRAAHTFAPRARSPLPASPPQHLPRARANQEEFGGSLEEVLSSRPRHTPTAPRDLPGLEEVLSSRPRHTPTTPRDLPSLEEVLSSSRRRHTPTAPTDLPAASAVCPPRRQRELDDPWGGDTLESVLQAHNCERPSQHRAHHREGLHNTVHSPTQHAGEPVTAAQTPPPLDPLAQQAPRVGPPPSADLWGGSLGDILPRRASASASRRTSVQRPSVPPRPEMQEPQSTGRSRRRPDGPRVARADATAQGDDADYYSLMQMHMQDNVARKHAASWRELLALLRTVRRPTRADGTSCPAEEETACSICLDGLHRAGSVACRQPVCALPCGHQFHRQCITQALRQGHGCCPNCRYDLRADAAICAH